MTSGDLDIDLSRKCLSKSCRSFNDLSNAVCRLSIRCVIFYIWRGPKRPPAQNRTFRSPPGIGLSLCSAPFLLTLVATSLVVASQELPIFYVRYLLESRLPARVLNFQFFLSRLYELTLDMISTTDIIQVAEYVNKLKGKPNTGAISSAQPPFSTASILSINFANALARLASRPDSDIRLSAVAQSWRIYHQVAIVALSAALLSPSRRKHRRSQEYVDSLPQAGEQFSRFGAERVTQLEQFYFGVNRTVNVNNVFVEWRMYIYMSKDSPHDTYVSLSERFENYTLMSQADCDLSL